MTQFHQDTDQSRPTSNSEPLETNHSNGSYANGDGEQHSVAPVTRDYSRQPIQPYSPSRSQQLDWSPDTELTSSAGSSTSPSSSFDSVQEGTDVNPGSEHVAGQEINGSTDAEVQDSPRSATHSSSGSRFQSLNLLRDRLKQRRSTGRPWYKKIWVWGLFGTAVLIGGGIGYGGWKLREIYHALPEVTDLSAYNRDGTLTIKAADGTILMQAGPATRDKVQIEKMPDLLVKGFVAVEDRRFEQHNGVDYQGIMRAITANVMARDVVEGGSTITQQLARVVFLDQEQSLVRKLREAMLAQKMERNMTKQEILERYLNLVYLGSGAYGVADAAWVYFSKPVQQLTLSEIATLAGVPPAPSKYSPLVDVEAAKQRRNVVLFRMQEAGLINEARTRSAMQQPLNVNPSSPKRLRVKAPYFTSYIQKELPKYVPADALELGGLTVETTVHLPWQKIAQEVVREAVEVDGASEGFEQAALVAVDPRNGEVKALVGGVDFKESEFNRAFQAQRQPGSTFKGLIYSAAIAAGFSPYDSYMDEPYRVDGYRPMNYSKRHSGWQSMSSALSQSLNVVAVKVLVDVGFDPAIKIAKGMGIQSKLQPTYSLALGAYEVNLLELTNAYGTLAAEGKHIPAHGIRKVVNQKGEVIYEDQFKPKPVLDKGSASITTWMLEGVIESGTGTSARLSDRAAAGKTGTSEDYRDLWFVGYIPQLVTGVWLGNDDNQPTWGKSETAAYNWRQFMKRVTPDIPAQDLPNVPTLDGRKGSIKAKPFQPNTIQTGSAAVKKDDDDYHQYFSKQQSGQYASQSSDGYYDDGYYDDGYYNDGYSDEGYYNDGYYDDGYYDDGYSNY
ncbi:MAG: transglycosylase domain-containing protein [Microcoleaceae cyanobacterium]